MATNQTTTQSTINPGFDGPVDNPNGFVRYARILKRNGQAVTCYRTTAGTTTSDKGTLAYLAKLLGCKTAALPTYVAYNHATMVAAGFGTWAPCYAYTCAMANSALAPSVVGSLGKGGLALVPAPCTLREGASALATVPVQ